MESKQLLRVARTEYKNMTRAWYAFAKIIFEVKKTEAFKVSGHKNFRQYCLKEFPTTNYKTMIKFVKIIEILGPEIENKAKQTKYQLPSYEACYQLINIPKPSDDTREKVLTSAISYRDLRASHPSKPQATPHGAHEAQDHAAILVQLLPTVIELNDIIDERDQKLLTSL